MKKTLFSIVLTTFPLLCVAQDLHNYSCSMGELTRRVQVMYETGVTVPCEVHYYKDTEAPGEREVLWRALNEAGYCEARATEFVAKLEGMGWACTGAGDDGADAPAEEEEMTDDTSALTPVADQDNIEIDN